LRKYRKRLKLLLEGYKLKRSGTGLKLKGKRFGNLTIDPVALQADSLRALADDGDVMFQTQVDESLYDLLTKRFDKSKRYTPHAVETFKRLAALAGLPIHGRGKSKKHKLIHGGVLYYNDPDALVERLHLLCASKQAGNTGLDNEISAILDELLRGGAISKELTVQLNKRRLL